MTNLKHTLAGAALVAFSLIAAGCGDTAPDDHQHDHDHGHGAHDDGGAEGAALDADDQNLVEAQKVCPVSGEALGSMGTPIKVMAGDKTVFLCCEGCRKTFEKNPQKYAEKLGN